MSRVLAVFAALWGTGAVAHEVRPSVADVQFVGDVLHLEIRLSAEALVAGINLDGLADTNEAPEGRDYDALRLLPPEQLDSAFRRAWPGLAEGFRITVGAERLTPDLGAVKVPEVGDTDLPRDTAIVLTAPLPAGDAPVLVGWDARFGPLILRQMGAGEGAYTGYLTGGAQSDPLPRTGAATETGMTAFGRYMVLGFQHIVPRGLDHILFVLGLFLFSLRLRPLLTQVTAFTVAHTLTLALAALGLISIPAAVVEPLIAASIVYVAVENILMPRLTPWRTAVVFGFGLLHGLGFAAILGEVGLEPARFLTGLIGFNIGVELGQLSVILAAFATVGIWFGPRPWYRARIVIPASAIIACVGAWWSIERVFL